MRIFGMMQAQSSSVIYQPGNLKCLASSPFDCVCVCVCTICLCIKTIEGVVGVTHTSVLKGTGVL